MRALAAATLALALFSGQVSAQENQAGIFQVPANSNQKIDRHQTCRIVKNGSANPIMVPTNTAQEWSSGTNSFLTNISNMPSVTASDCILSINPSYDLNMHCAIALINGHSMGAAHSCMNTFHAREAIINENGETLTTFSLEQVMNGLKIPALDAYSQTVLPRICQEPDMASAPGKYGIFSVSGNQYLMAIFECV